MSIAQSTLVQRIRWHLGDKPWETTGGADSATSVIVAEEGDEWSKGDIGEFDDGDTFYVRKPTIVTDDLLATRSYYGSTAASHSSGSRIVKNPKYTFMEITNAISECIEFTLPWPTYYKVQPIVITPLQDIKWYDVGLNTLGIVRAVQTKGTTLTEAEFYNSRHMYNRIELRRGLDSVIVASGTGLTFIDGVNNLDNDITVVCAGRITDTVVASEYSDFSAGDPITTAIEYGAVSLLHGSLELRKPRHAADEVDYLRGASVFDNLARKARANAEAKLRREDPLMLSVAQ